MAVAGRGRGGPGSGLMGIRSIMSYPIFVSVIFSLLFLAALKLLFTSPYYPSSSDPDMATTGDAYIHRSFLALKSDPLKTRLDLIHKQAHDHIMLVNAYAAYARKLKLDNSRQLKLYDDLAMNFTNMLSKPAYRAALFETEGTVDEDVLRQFEKEVKDKVKVARLMISEAKESYDNQMKIQKLKDTIFAVHEQFLKAKKNGAIASFVAAKSVPKSLHCLAMRLVGERVAHPEKYKEEEPKAEFEDPTLYHYAIFSENVIAVSVVVNSVVKNANEPWKHVFHVVTDRKIVAAMKVWFKMRPARGGAHVEVKAVEDFNFLNPSYVPVLRQLESAKSQTVENQAENAAKDVNNMKFSNPKYLSMLSHLRFYLPEMYPDLHRIVLLDDDVVVQKDLTDLWNIDLDGKNEDHTLWQFGTLSAGLATFYSKTKSLDKSWHVLGLGYNPSVSMDEITNAAVIHFSGSMKPWLDIAMNQYKELWTKYVDNDMEFVQMCNFGL
ncbi:putative galacturonosyltransferase 9 [Bienertia sinuspersici]